MIALALLAPAIALASTKKKNAAAVVPMRTDVVPFPVPAVGPVTAETRYSAGLVVTAYDTKSRKFHISTAAGELVCELDNASRVIGSDKRVTDARYLLQGASVRVYYETGTGALVQEVDVMAAR